MSNYQHLSATYLMHIKRAQNHFRYVQKINFKPAASHFYPEQVIDQHPLKAMLFEAT